MREDCLWVMMKCSESARRMQPQNSTLSEEASSIWLHILLTYFVLFRLAAFCSAWLHFIAFWQGENLQRIGKAGTAACRSLPVFGVADAGNDEDSLQSVADCPGVVQYFQSVCLLILRPVALICNSRWCPSCLSFWYTGVDLACRLGDKAKIPCLALILATHEKPLQQRKFT